jgi:hypothetical protein
MSPLRACFAFVLAACPPPSPTPAAETAHPLGESTAPGPAVPPPLVVDNTPQSFSSRPLSSTGPGVVYSRPAAPAPAETAPATVPAAAPANAQAPAPAYTGGTSSTIAPNETSPVPTTPSGVSSETNQGTPSGVPANAPSGTADQPATGVMAPPPPSEP